MRISLDAVLGAVKSGVLGGDRDESIRVGVYIDEGASPFVVGTLRDALVPQTTTGLVRVDRLVAEPVAPKPDTDVIIVATSGSPTLEGAVQRLVVFGVPVVVVVESSVEAPFITQDSPMLGLVAATDADYLTSELARWVLDRTDKGDAFAATFAFMRDAMAERIVTSTAVNNLMTGALGFIPGADFPVMTLAQASMTLRLAQVRGYALSLERGYELAGVIGTALFLRAVTRLATRRMPPAATLVVKALVGGAGTYGMGLALDTAYRRGIDYTRANEAVSRVASTVRGAAADVVAGRRGGATEA